MHCRFLGILSLLALAATLVSATSLRDRKLPQERFQGWAVLQDDCSETMIAQTWRQQLPNLPKGVDGYLMVSYRVITVESPLAATADADRLRQRDQLNDMIAKGYKVTSTPWVVKGKTGALFSVSGLSQTTKSTRAQHADIFTLPFAQDAHVVFLQVRQVGTADDLIAPERVLLTAGGKALAEELALYLLSQWIEAPKSAEPKTPPEKPALLEFTVEPTPDHPVEPTKVVAPETPPAASPPSNTAPPTATDTGAKPTAPVTPPAQPAPSEEPKPLPTAPVTPPLEQQAIPLSPPVTLPVPANPSTPATKTPDKPRWQTADGNFSCILPTGWTVSGKTSYLISGLANVPIRLFPPETYANDTARERAFAEFIANQQDIALQDFAQSQMTMAESRGINVRYTDYAHNTTYAYLMARSGRLWRLLVTVPGENSSLPGAVAALVESIRLQ